MKRILNLVLSDLHIGNNTLAERTGGLAYGRKQAKRRLGKVVREASRYKFDHRRETDLVVWILGDLGRGEIHGTTRMSEEVSDQIALLGGAVRRLRREFGDRVRVNCVTGNHGRFMTRHPERAADDKSDSFETIVYRTLGGANVPGTPYVDGKQFGWRILATHGDTMFKLPNPGRSINMASIEQRLNRWTASRWRPDVLILGHHHTPTIQVMPAGNTVIINGSLCPADEYCLSVDLPSTPSSQVMFETTAAHAVGDMRLVRLTEADDRDRSLDSWIKEST
jgi:predicted phosphodiesterase